jgi:hypothetical protein
MLMLGGCDRAHQPVANPSRVGHAVDPSVHVPDAEDPESVRDDILKLIDSEESSQIVSAQTIAYNIGLTLKEVVYHLRVLARGGYVELQTAMAGPDAVSAWITHLGEQRVAKGSASHQPESLSDWIHVDVAGVPWNVDTRFARIPCPSN